MLNKSKVLFASAVAMGVMGAIGQAEAQTVCVEGANASACTNAAGQTRNVITTGSPGASVSNAGTVLDSVQTSGNNSTVDNTGIVGDAALSLDGIITTGTNSDVTNSGTVVGTIETVGPGSDVVNSGSILNQILTRGDNSSVTNYGTVDNNIATYGNNSNITNSGRVRSDIETYGDNSIIVNSGTTESSIITFGNNSGITNSGIVLDRINTQGDSSNIVNSGTVENVVHTFGDNSGITNSGTVRDDLETSGANSDISNSGTVEESISTFGVGSDISNSGTVQDSINTQGNNSSVTNSGTVQADIFTGGDNSGVTNSETVLGSIVTFGDNSAIANSGTVGIFMRTEGDNASITNSGSVGDFIVTVGTGSNIINSGTASLLTTDGNESSITNSGLVSVVFSSGSNSNVTNSGTINSFVSVAGDGSTLTNSGRIGTSGNGNTSLVLSGQNQTLTLSSGSIINESIAFQFPATATLNFGPGLNALLTLNGMPTTVNGAAVVVQGNQVAALDATGFSVQDDMLADLTSGIFNSVYGRLAGGGGAAFSSSSGMQLGMSPMMQLGMMNLGATDEPVTASPQLREGVWADVFGGLSNDDGGGNTIGSDTQYFGGVAGIDGSLAPGVLIGAFAGAARSDLEIDANQQNLDADSYFGGAYVSRRTSSYFANLIVTAGQTDYDSTRFINNNFAPGGIETATASYDGTFISPELSIGTTYSLGGIAIEPSVRGRYAFLALDGYTESGSAAAVTVADRDVSLWLGRVQVAFPVSNHNATFAPRIGVEAWTSDSDDVSAVLLGQAIGFAPGGDDSQVTGFFGATATVNISGSVSAFLDGEVHAGDDGLDRSEGRAGLKINF